MAAAFAGISASTKYPFGLVMLSVLAVEYFVQQRQNQFSFKGYSVSCFKIIGTTFALFFMISPYILIDFEGFKQHFLNQMATHQTNPGRLDQGFTYHLKFSLWHGMGFSALIASFLGMFFALRKNTYLHGILIGFVVLFYLVIGFNHYLFVRYILPLVPVLCIYAAWASIHAIKIFSFKYQRTNALSILILLLLPSLYNTYWFDHLIAKEDTRSIARKWLLKHLKKEDGIGIGVMFTHVDLPMSYDKYFLSPLQLMGSTQIMEEAMPPSAQYSTTPFGRHEFYISTYRDTETLRNLNIKYVTIGLINMPLYRIPQQEFDGIQNTPDLALVKRIPIYKKTVQTDPLLKPPEHVTPEGNYDAIDGFFIPYVPDPDIIHPGPEIFIYKVL